MAIENISTEGYVGRLRQMRAQTVGRRSEDASLLPSANHFKAAGSEAIAKQASAMGLRRMAGNMFICVSTRDLWNVVGGRIRRLTGVEVDNGEKMVGAPKDDPSSFLQDALDDLTF